MNDKLYKVNLRGARSLNGNDYSTFWVVAKDPTQAYSLVRSELDSRNLCFPHDKELLSVELIAEDCEYPECRTRLIVEKERVAALFDAARKLVEVTGEVDKEFGFISCPIASLSGFERDKISPWIKEEWAALHALVVKHDDES